MDVEGYIAGWVAEAPVLAGSFAVVLLMIGIAAVLGFRQQARLDEAALAQLASEDGAHVESAVVAANGKQALAKLSGGKLMVARVMGNDISARSAPASALTVRIAGGKLSAGFADLGYPPLNIKLADTPAWLAALAAGDAT